MNPKEAKHISSKDVKEYCPVCKTHKLGFNSNCQNCRDEHIVLSCIWCGGDTENYYTNICKFCNSKQQKLGKKYSGIIKEFGFEEYGFDLGYTPLDRRERLFKFMKKDIEKFGKTQRI